MTTVNHPGDRAAAPTTATLLFVNGTLMRGLELHANLEGATFVEETRTARRYRLHSIGDRHPGMHRVERDGVAVEGELYLVPRDVLDRVIAGEPPGLYVGQVDLTDGRVVPGVLYRRELLAPDDRDISDLGSWRAYLGARSPRTTPGA